METLSTVIKFVGAGNVGPGGGGSATDAASAATSGVATGDISMLIAGIVLALIGAFAFVAARKYATATSGAHVQANTKISAPIIAAFAAVLLGLTLSVVGASQMRAHADANDALQQSGDVIGTVDEQTGDTVFADVTITNTSENAQNISNFALNAVEDIDVSDITWKITIGDTVVFNNKIGETSSFTAFDIAANSSVIMKVEALDLTSDLAKSLINKEVATGDTTYDICYKVTIAVDDQTKGSVDTTAVSCVNGTTFSSNQNKLTIGTTVITATPNDTFAFDSWDPDAGTISSATTITAKFKNAEPAKVSMKVNNVQYWPVFTDNNVPSGYTFYAKLSDDTYEELTNVTTMKTLKKAYDACTNAKELCYAKDTSSTNQLKGVAGKNESFNLAFGSTTAATSGEYAKADEYDKTTGTFEDKSSVGSSVVCETLNWYIDRSEGGYLPPTTEPTIKDGNSNSNNISNINSAYSLDSSSTGYFWTCVSAIVNPPRAAHAWNYNDNKFDIQDRETKSFVVVFSRVFN